MRTPANFGGFTDVGKKNLFAKQRNGVKLIGKKLSKKLLERKFEFDGRQPINFFSLSRHAAMIHTGDLLQ